LADDARRYLAAELGRRPAWPAPSVPRSGSRTTHSLRHRRSRRRFAPTLADNHRPEDSGAAARRGCSPDRVAREPVVGRRPAQPPFPAAGRTLGPTPNPAHNPGRQGPASRSPATAERRRAREPRIGRTWHRATAGAVVPAAICCS
jgi:hypothetical protein